MKRKTLALLLCAVLLLTACTAPPPETTAPPTTQPVEITTAPPETTSPATQPQPSVVCSVNEESVTLGNLEIQIPVGFSAEMVNDNSIMLKNEIHTCGVLLFAADISDLDEESTRIYLPMQQEQFLTEGVVHGEADTEYMRIGGMTVDFQIYGEMYTDLSTQMVVEATFTDSWFAYTIKMVEPIADDYGTDNVTAVMKALVGAQYTGPAARFDFVQ